MTEPRLIADGLAFPEGPVAMPDGSVLLVELERGTLTRVDAAGHTTVVADVGGSPNGAAIGPDGQVWICNNGRFFDFAHYEGIGCVPSRAATSQVGSIQRVDPHTGEFHTVYTACEGVALTAPNDLVFDTAGGFWFTDHGVEDDPERAGVLYAT